MDALRSGGTDSGKLSLTFDNTEQAALFAAEYGRAGGALDFDVPISVITSVNRESSGRTRVKLVGDARLRLAPGIRRVNRTLIDAMVGIPTSFAYHQLVYAGGCFETGLPGDEATGLVMAKLTPGRIATIVQRPTGGTRLEGKNGERFGTSATVGSVLKELGTLITVTACDDLRRAEGVVVTHADGFIEVRTDFDRATVSKLLGA